MKAIELEPIQLRLGETIVKTEHKKGILQRNNLVVVPTRNGHCEAALGEDIEVEKLKGKRFNLSAFKAMHSFTVKNNINGDDRRWPLPQDSIIGARSRLFRKKKKEVMYIIKGVSPFL
jgi:hypothetical protein